MRALNDNEKEQNDDTVNMHEEGKNKKYIELADKDCGLEVVKDESQQENSAQSLNEATELHDGQSASKELPDLGLEIRLYNLHLPCKIYESKSKDQWIWVGRDKEEIEFLKRESAVYRKFSQLTNLFPKLIDAYETNEGFIMITEALPAQNLAEVLDKNSLQLTDVLQILSSLSRAVSILHNEGLVYRALRPEVVLVGKPIKIIDFRWTEPLGGVITRTYDFGIWTPPETLRVGNKIDQRADIYSIGMILYYYVKKNRLNEKLDDLEAPDFKVPFPGIPQILHRTCNLEVSERYYSAQILMEKLAKLRKSYLPKISYEIHCQSTIGLDPNRKTNQDAYGFRSGSWKSENHENRWFIACVADGMGGMESGEVASEVSVRYILKRSLEDEPFSFDSVTQQNEYLKTLIVAANEEVIKEMKKRNADGGTTIVCAFAVNENLVINYVGDSRAYLVRDGDIKFLTQDHSLAAVLSIKDKGEVVMEELRNDENRNVLVLALGTRERLEQKLIGDLVRMTGTNHLKLLDGDLIILCTDGVWEPVLEKEMLQICLSHQGSLKEIADRLIALAMQRGGPDNATVLIIKVGYYKDNPEPIGESEGRNQNVEGFSANE